MVGIFESILFLLLVWLINLETNPSLGGIWWRVNVNGDKCIQIGNALNFAYHSFFDPIFWNLNMLDVNIITFLSLGLILIYSLQYIIKNIY